MKKVLLLTLALKSAFALASSPASFTYQGRVYKANGVDPLESSAVVFKVQLRSPDGLCLLFEETHTRNMTGTSGIFSLNIGEGTNTNASALSLVQVFDQNTAKVGAAACAYTPVAGDYRRLRFSYDDGVEQVSMPTDQTIRSVPWALASSTLEGINKDGFVRNIGSVTQVKVEGLTNKYADILALLTNASAGGYVVNNTPASVNHAVNRNYVDARVAGREIDLSGLADGQSMVWNVAQNKFVASTPTLATSGVTAGTYNRVTVDAYGRVTAGANMTDADLPTISTPGKVSGSAITSGTIGGSTVINISGNITSANMSSTTSSAQSLRLFDSTNTRKVTMSIPNGIAADYNFVLPVNDGASGQILSTDGSGNLSWITDATTPAAGGAGQFLRSNGAAWTSSYANASDMKTALGVSQIPTNCLASQTLVYSIGTDTYACTDIAIASSKVSGLGTAAAKNFPAAGDAAAMEVVLGNDSRLTNGRAPTGAAGGDLSGTYPNPSLATSGVTPGTYSKVTVDAKGRVTTGTNLSAADVPTLDWSKISSMLQGLEAARPVAGTAGRIYIATDSLKIFRDNGTTWDSYVAPVVTGTGANQIVKLDSNSKLPAVDASQLTNIPIPFSNHAVFTASGTWNVPAGVTKVYIQVWGGGGGGGGGSTLLGGGGTGGGGGGYAAGIFTLSNSNPVSVTIGAGGAKGTATNAGGTGGTSSFGGYASAGGGVGGSAAGEASVDGGTSTATINSSGGRGGPNMGYVGGIGGSAGNGGGQGSYGSANNNHANAGTAPGGGGGGGWGTLLVAKDGGAGAVGRIIVWY